MRCKHRNKHADPNRPNKQNGYMRNLYRNTREGKVAGVCAGFAQYFDVPNWVARLVFISLVIFTFQLALIAYVVAIFMMAKREDIHEGIGERGYSEKSNTRYSGSKSKVFNYSKPVSSRLQDIRDRLRRLDEQVGAMEGYVTSKKYQTTNDINDL